MVAISKIVMMSPACILPIRSGVFGMLCTLRCLAFCEGEVQCTATHTVQSEWGRKLTERPTRALVTLYLCTIEPHQIYMYGYAHAKKVNLATYPCPAAALFGLC